MKILLHPGFHKTGTTSLQRAALHNEDVLRQRVNLYLPRELGQLGQIAKRCSRFPSKARFRRVEHLLGEALQKKGINPACPVLMSYEELAGVIPGRKDVWSYAQTPKIVRKLIRGLRREFGPEAQIIVWFTTREQRQWAESVYWQNLRSNRITDDFEDYYRQLSDNVCLHDVIDKTRDQIGETVQVLDTDITECAGPMGPLGGGA